MPDVDPLPKLLSLAVHEFRTPLTIVAGYIRMLLRERAGALTEPQRKLIEEAERSCGRLSGLIAELSDLSNLEAGSAPFNRGRLAVAALVRQAAAEVTAAAEPPTRAEVRGTLEGAVTILGDSQRLGHALRAVIGAVLRETLKADGVLVAPVIVTETGALHIVIGDAETVAAVERLDMGALDAFDEWRGGAGLSLPIARRVIEAHGGAVYAPRGERARRGAVVVLPLAPPHADDAATPAPDH